MKNYTPDISVIIPAFNEAQRIRKNLDEIIAYFRKTKQPYEILIVNDGSEDDTQFVAEEYARMDPRIRIFHYEENRGKGYAVKIGMLNSRGQVCLFTDSDGSVHIHHLEKFYDTLVQGHDVVIGSIEIAGNSVTEGSAWYRRILGSLSKKLIQVVAVKGIYDTQRGFKLFTRQAMLDIFSRQTIDRWGFDIELLVIAQQHEYRIKELPVTWINPKGSTVDADRFAFTRTLKELVEIVVKSALGMYAPQKARLGRFLPVRS